jgi:hypothetical protein
MHSHGMKLCLLLFIIAKAMQKDSARGHFVVAMSAQKPPFTSAHHWELPDR